MAAAAQGKGIDWRPVNPAAHCGRRPFFALGKARAAYRRRSLPWAKEWQQRGGRRRLTANTAQGKGMAAVNFAQGSARQGMDWQGQQDRRRPAAVNGQLCPGQGKGSKNSLSIPCPFLAHSLPMYGQLDSAAAAAGRFRQ